MTEKNEFRSRNEKYKPLTSYRTYGRDGGTITDQLDLRSIRFRILDIKLSGFPLRLFLIFVPKNKQTGFFLSKLQILKPVIRHKILENREI